METDDNSSGALGAGEHAGGSHQLQSPGSARAPTSKSECTKNCNRSKCGFLFDDRLNYADADMVCVSVHDEMEGEPPSKPQHISGGGGENVQLRRGVRERKRTSNGQAQKPRNLAGRRRWTKIRGISVQRRRYRSWASPGPAKRRRYLAAAVKLGDGLSAVGPRASWCGYGDALWKKHRAGRARVHRGTHGFVCWESMNLIDHGRNLRASLPSVRAIGDPLYHLPFLLKKNKHLYKKKLGK